MEEQEHIIKSFLISLLPAFLCTSLSDGLTRKIEKKNKLLLFMSKKYQKCLEHFTKILGNTGMPEKIHEMA